MGRTAEEQLFVFLLVSVFHCGSSSGRKEEKVKLQLDKGRRYGIVLEGGGARGAYQIGAWKALKAGIQIQGSRNLCGALNGALICMDDFETAEKIWENIRYSQVMDVDDKRMEALREWNLKNGTAVRLSDLLNGVKRLLKEGGFDITPCGS